MDVRARAHRWWLMAGRRWSQDVNPGLLDRLVTHYVPEGSSTEALTPDEQALLNGLDVAEIDQDMWWCMSLEALADGVSASELLYLLADALENSTEPYRVGFCGQRAGLIPHSRPSA